MSDSPSTFACRPRRWLPRSQSADLIGEGTFMECDWGFSIYYRSLVHPKKLKTMRLVWSLDLAMDFGCASPVVT